MNESSSISNQYALVLQERSYELSGQTTTFLQALIFLPKNLALWTDVSLLLLTTCLFGREMRKKITIETQGGIGVEFSLSPPA